MTNSPRKVSLTAEQLKELKRDYCEILVDNMDTKTLVQYVYDDLLSWCDGLTSEVMREEVKNYDEGLFNELVDNLTNPNVNLRVIK